MNQSGFDWAFQLHQSKASLVPTLRWTQHVLHHWLLPMQQLIWWSGNSQDRCAACRKDVGNVWKSGNLEPTFGWVMVSKCFFLIFKPVRYLEKWFNLTMHFVFQIGRNQFIFWKDFGSPLGGAIHALGRRSLHFRRTRWQYVFLGLR